MKFCHECVATCDENAVTCPLCGGASFGPSDGVECGPEALAEPPARTGKKAKRQDKAAPPKPQDEAAKLAEKLGDE